MKSIEKIDGGFIQTFDDGLINRLEAYYTGNLRISFADGRCSEMEIECSSYNAQYGFCVSKDGSTLYVGSWEKGLFAYDIAGGKLKWQCRKAKIRTMLIFPEYLLALRGGEAIVMLDLGNGTIRKEIRSSTIERMFQLENGDILVDSIRGKLSLIDTSFSVKRSFKPQTVNPQSCLAHKIRDAYIKDGEIYISGFEEYPGRDHTAKGQILFERSIGEV